ncbi:unnamed protein product [Paramecium pentaurelia]|uniref:Uncharacterized protein n=1 Tax=Paramecium pentaurelia TaxID=43138 RepID=A0A8S1X0R0_9CILI|nr:unnamed protein product [Paramecium pentaurelia]
MSKLIKGYYNALLILKSKSQFVIQKNIQQIHNIFLKIVKLNQNNNYFQAEQFKQEKINELNNQSQLKYLMRLFEQILLQAIQEIKDKKRNPFYLQNCQTDYINCFSNRFCGIPKFKSAQLQKGLARTGNNTDPRTPVLWSGPWKKAEFCQSPNPIPCFEQGNGILSLFVNPLRRFKVGNKSHIIIFHKKIQFQKIKFLNKNLLINYLQ